MKTIFITGASRGIGFETANSLLRHPDVRLILSSRNSKKLETWKQRLSPSMAEAITTVELDLEDDVDFEAFGEKIQNFVEIDVLINNAGLLINKPFEKLAPDVWRKVFEVNFFGVVRLVQNLLPKMKAAPSAHIVNIGSMGGFQGSSKFAGLSAYSASKAALANLTECLAGELAPYQIKSNCLCLGAVNTEMLSRAFPGYKAPLESQDMGKFIADFCLNGDRFFNGQILPVALNDPE